MAHKKIDDSYIVDWTTGDPEGDRIHVMGAYRDFIIQIQDEINNTEHHVEESYDIIVALFKLWKIDTGNQIDEVPRIWITRPKN